VGAGPSGFYAAGMLLDRDFAVDLFDALPTPFGLVRAGVAPDHPKIKTVTRVFDKIIDDAGAARIGEYAVGCHEVARGEPEGRPRNKVMRRSEMHSNIALSRERSTI
jgi:ferredoxin/flavodoxin---NADP+ reductase